MSCMEGCLAMLENVSQEWKRDARTDKARGRQRAKPE